MIDFVLGVATSFGVLLTDGILVFKEIIDGVASLGVLVLDIIPDQFVQYFALFLSIFGLALVYKLIRG